MHLLINICDHLPDDVKCFLHHYYSTYKKKYETDSGIDLVIPNNYVIHPHQSHASQIHLGIRCSPVSQQPHGYYLYPRSSLAKTQLRLANSVGIIDYEFTGELIACVDNIGDHDEPINVQGDDSCFSVVKLFQLCAPDLTPITFELVYSLNATERGAGAFGSTN